MNNNQHPIYPLPESKYRSTCPYCGFEQLTHVQPTVYGNLIVCDSEMGGCDKPYVITVVVVAYVAARSIDGYAAENETVTEVTP